MEQPEITPEVRAYQKWVASKGGKAVSTTKRSLAAKRTSKWRWRLRYAKYGSSGRRFKPGWFVNQFGHQPAVKEQFSTVSEPYSPPVSGEP